ncbi:hypothetical protein Psuf_059070 [Phytohabitans suffuscus]|uniref:CoA transferase n=1 Tax=Phytohabitans suffuscus TaxID=624315 RepID=A0A6F8YR67_9ACTN|nr:hypothetical protein Psuf_059070 [Phytohabitans suffuscus]
MQYRAASVQQLDGRLVVGPVPRLSQTPGRIRSHGPELGEHTDVVLGELIGLDHMKGAPS